MKNLKTYICAFAMLALAPSCNKWLDVDNDTNRTAEVQFSDYEGYRAAVNGVYLLLSSRNLYAENLSWGMASVLGNNYDTSAGSNLPAKWKQFFTQPYTNEASRGVISPIWEAGYNVIANANEILVNIENTDDNFFPPTAHERDVIKGEMLGVRAMVHLDLLRLFAPAVKADDGKVHIPYVDTYPVRSTTALTVSETLRHIIADLEQARGLLKYNDTEDEVNSAAFRSASVRFYAVSVGSDRFLNTRGLRMNWFAATALLARAYSWAGELKPAHAAAAEMLAYGPDGEGWINFSGEYEVAWSGSDYMYRKLYDDILLAAWRPEMVVEYAESLPLSNTMRLVNVAALFGSDTNDWRYSPLIEGTISQRWVLPATATDQAVVQQMKLAPVIRMSECYYAMIEYLAGTDLAKANEMLGKMRSARGATTPIAYATQAELLDALHNEMMREFQTEGQTFFLFKRLNQPLWNGTNPAIDMSGRWVLPLPRSENEYI